MRSLFQPQSIFSKLGVRPCFHRRYFSRAGAVFAIDLQKDFLKITKDGNILPPNENGGHILNISFGLVSQFYFFEGKGFSFFFFGLVWVCGGILAGCWREQTSLQAPLMTDLGMLPQTVQVQFPNVPFHPAQWLPGRIFFAGGEKIRHSFEILSKIELS